MCFLQIHVQCYDKFFEVLPEEVENAELAVEDVVSQVLLELFGEGTVDEVTICFSPNLRMGLRHCSIQIRAQCPCESFSLFPNTKEHIKSAVENRMGSLLKELFVSVNIESVMLSSLPQYYGGDPAPSLYL
jgi:hypothetical protein